MEPADQFNSALREGTADSLIGNIVFFDGVCLLCDGSVRFLLRRDVKRILRFATLQGHTGKNLFASGMLPATQETLTSIIYLRNQPGSQPEVFTRSTAILQILSDLGGVWRTVSWIRIIPRSLRDLVYNCIARHRYRWFGRRPESCFVPRPTDRDRFMD